MNSGTSEDAQGPSRLVPDEKEIRKVSSRILSCAECRRLKLKCDRTFPCESCVKRGCAEICPTGSLTTSQHGINRFVLAGSEQLHGRIGALSDRIRALEDALAASHERYATGPHPLLSDDLLRIKAPLERNRPEFSSGSDSLGDPQQDEEEVSAAFGTLSISKDGSSHFYGGPANSWYILQNELQASTAPQQHESDSSGGPAQNLAFTSQFLDLPERKIYLLVALPSASRVLELFEIYDKRVTWMYCPIGRSEFMSEIFSHVFPDGTQTCDPQALKADCLAVMFFVLALSILVDPRQPMFDRQANSYYELGCQALGLEQCMNKPTTFGVQTLFLRSVFMFFSDGSGLDTTSRSPLLGAAVRMAYLLGLDRGAFDRHADPVTEPNLFMFQEMYGHDILQAFTFGRPPSLHYYESLVDPPSQDMESWTFHQWKFTYLRFLNHVIDTAFAARAPSYSVVQSLSAKVRNWPVPSHLRLRELPPGTKVDVFPVLQQHTICMLVQAILLYLHRVFFARAITEFPNDPLGCPFGHSVISAYETSCAIVSGTRLTLGMISEGIHRYWFFYAHAFSAAMILASICTQCPALSFSGGALAQLDALCDIFQNISELAHVKKTMQILRQLQQKAHTSLEKYHSGQIAHQVPRPLAPGSYAYEAHEELRLLGSQTAVSRSPSELAVPARSRSKLAALSAKDIECIDQTRMVRRSSMSRNSAPRQTVIHNAPITQPTATNAWTPSPNLIVPSQMPVVPDYVPEFVPGVLGADVTDSFTWPAGSSTKNLSEAWQTFVRGWGFHQ
ncbi:hypothetical protein SISNIDRAFT_46734 [Sistotremastrum niveocremeum HHB9708]|uniref:Zn(2)-C6 fungal-type domain-containing protein n=1 Tax=Sistotremastrum niveocremeum HHB9708 TaxID=1314777 RepID=A0A164VVF4_9AGAM|nr:hypothetical protein SISNIDRAFT_46734 [Sistotremastrum niveocremeum HHB9708]